MTKNEIIKTYYKKLLEELNEQYEELAEQYGNNLYLLHTTAESVIEWTCGEDFGVGSNITSTNLYDENEPFESLDEFEMEIFKKYKNNSSKFLKELAEFAEKVCEKYPNNKTCEALLSAIYIFVGKGLKKEELETGVDDVLSYINVKENISDFIKKLENIDIEDIEKYNFNLDKLNKQELKAVKKFLENSIEETNKKLYHGTISYEHYNGEGHWETSVLSSYEEQENEKHHKILNSCHNLLKEVKKRLEKNNNLNK